MKKYTVKADHNGVVMIGKKPYRPSQEIIDTGKDPKTTSRIETLLKLKNPPIEVVEEQEEQNTAVNSEQVKQEAVPVPSVSSAKKPDPKLSKE